LKPAPTKFLKIGQRPQVLFQAIWDRIIENVFSLQRPEKKYKGFGVKETRVKRKRKFLKLITQDS
jgi:hypothetical protein